MRRRRLAIVLLLAAAGLLLAPLLAETAQEWLAAGTVTADPAGAPECDVVLVLATAPMVVRDTPNPDFEARLDTAAALWKQKRARYILASGNGQRFGETWAMRKGLLERGVPGMAIYVDGESYRTWESVLHARDIFGLDRVLIVSQRAHLARALFLARSLGMHPYGVEAPQRLPPADMPSWYRVRPYLAAVKAFYDAAFASRPPPRHPPVRIGIDPPT
jgi:SanA protein